jgi:hypothetical protein
LRRLFVKSHNTDGSQNPNDQFINCFEGNRIMSYFSSSNLLSFNFIFPSNDSCIEVVTCLNILNMEKEDTEPYSKSISISVDRETKEMTSIELPEICKMKDVWSF